MDEESIGQEFWLKKKIKIKYMKQVIISSKEKIIIDDQEGQKDWCDFKLHWAITYFTSAVPRYLLT